MKPDLSDMYWERHCVSDYKNTENCQTGMEIKIGYYSETDYAGVKSDKFNPIWTMVVLVNHMFMHYIIITLVKHIQVKCNLLLKCAILMFNAL